MDVPFYVYEIFRRFCKPWGMDCDFCPFSPDEYDLEYDLEEGCVCPSDLWWYVMQRQEVLRKFDASHPPVCPNCGKRMVADGTVTYGDKDVAAFTCRVCHKFERDSRTSIQSARRVS